MRFITITILAATCGQFQDLAVAKPVPNQRAGGIAIPLARHSPETLDLNKSTVLDAIAAHSISVREKILSGLDNYEMNTGTMHPFAVKRDAECELIKRGASLSLTDYQNHFWVGDVSIGTPPVTLKLKIDTGTADMWVLQTGCTGICGGDRDLWDPHSSKSAKYQGNSFQTTYADGSIVKGASYTDNVTISGFSANIQTFGSATSYTSQLHNNECPADGVLGLAYPSISKLDASPLLATLAREGSLINPTFSLKLTSSGAEMYVGGANSILYKGPIAYTPVTHTGYWQSSMDDVRVNGRIVLNNVPVVFDTGASYIFGDLEQISELYKHLDATLVELGDFGFYYLRCDHFPTVSLTFGGKTFEIPPEVLRLNPIEEDSPNCFSAIIAQRKPFAFWAIGITFLQGVYSVFDYSTFQIGFADLA